MFRKKFIMMGDIGQDTHRRWGTQMIGMGSICRSVARQAFVRR